MSGRSERGEKPPIYIAHGLFEIVAGVVLTVSAVLIAIFVIIICFRLSNAAKKLEDAEDNLDGVEALLQQIADSVQCLCIADASVAAKNAPSIQPALGQANKLYHEKQHGKKVAANAA